MFWMFFCQGTIHLAGLENDGRFDLYDVTGFQIATLSMGYFWGMGLRRGSDK
jgi:hypothetical protein